MDRHLAAHFAVSDVLSRRAKPELRNAIDYALRLGQIEAVLPGVYAQQDHKTFPEVRIAALRWYEPAAVLLGEAAARVGFWPTLEVAVVVAAVPRRLTPQEGFRFVRRRVPEDLVTEIDGIRLAEPALAAIEAGPAVVDQALRENKTTLDRLWSAYRATTRWEGRAERERLVEESSDNPWSAAERLFHRLLRQAGLTGWRGNYRVGDHPVDVAFPAQRLAIEIDGKQYHGEANFEKDRWQQNALVLRGWRVLRFTWSMIEKHPGTVLETVRTALGQGTRPDRRIRPADAPEHAAAEDR